MFFVFYTQSVSPSAHGNFYELYAIAAAVLGGCSLRGGEGSILGIVLGTVLLQVLQNLVNILGIPSSLNFAVMGAVILLGVIADQRIAAPAPAQDRACERGGPQSGAPPGQRAGVMGPSAVRPRRPSSERPARRRRGAGAKLARLERGAAG